MAGLEIQAQYPTSLCFTVWGLYELFFEDAIVASKALAIALTKRGKGKDGTDIPMCGVPAHAGENYLARLIRQGYRVANCEQTEEAASRKTKGPLTRTLFAS